MKKDSWCKPVRSKTGAIVSGGAARNVRIAALGGMENIIADVTRYAFDRAEAAVNNSRNFPKLRLVSNRR